MKSICPLGRAPGRGGQRYFPVLDMGCSVSNIFRLLVTSGFLAW